MLHDPKYFNDPMEYQPERFLKDGKLNPDVMDINSVVFGLDAGQQIQYINCDVQSHGVTFPAFLLEDISATTRYT